MTEMKKISIAQTIGIVANVGVIAGIVFLGIEIRDSNTQATIATTQNVVDQAAGWKEFIAADEELSEIYVRGMSDFAQLSPRERTQFDLIMRARLQRYSGALLARNANLLNPNLGELEERVIEGELLYFLDQSGFQQWWSTVDRRGISVVIVDLVDEMEELRKGE